MVPGHTSVFVSRKRLGSRSGNTWCVNSSVDNDHSSANGAAPGTTFILCQKGLFECNAYD